MKSNEQFLQELKQINPNITPLESYKGCMVNIACKCDICGNEWKVRPNNLLNNKGCPKCQKSNAAKKITKSEAQIDEEIQNTHSNIKRIGKYINGQTKTKFKCEICNCEWEARPQDIIKKHRPTGCPCCANHNQWNADNFKAYIQEFRPNITLNEDYVKNTQKIKVTCNICGNQWQVTPKDLKRGHGCPCCKSSKGENSIKRILNKYNINYVPQYKITECRDKLPLPFDFYLNDFNILIEYDGEQHYNIRKILSFGKSVEQSLQILEHIQYHDKIKTEYCQTHNIKLIRIPYWKYNQIEQILITELKITHD